MLTIMEVDDLDALDLMPLEAPILKVSRPVAACSRCRTAKIKCDGKLPVSIPCHITSNLGATAHSTSKGMHIMREKRSGRRMYEYKRPIC